MIYLDNAATTYPKPAAVYNSLSYAMRHYGANPGRGGYAFAEQTAEAVYDSREKCAALFGADAQNVAFTASCTMAINMAVKGLAGKGVHYVISDIEHNAVLRPVHAAAAEYGGSYSIFSVAETDEQTLRNARRALKPETAAIICTAASNVIGRRLPIKGLCELCREKGICLVVDAAQGGGVLPLKMTDGINFLCCAGHKGLYGPMGTGLLIADGKFPLKTIIEGGTGSLSASPAMPASLPDRFESGTINTAGVIALGAGAEYIRRLSTASVLHHELSVCMALCEELRRRRRITLYNDITPLNSGQYAPVVSFNMEGIPPEVLSERLSQQGICMRAGLHCAPLAHRKIGTADTGTIRFSPSIFTTPAEVRALSAALDKI